VFDDFELLFRRGSLEVCQMIQVLVHGVLPFRFREFGHALRILYEFTQGGLIRDLAVLGRILQQLKFFGQPLFLALKDSCQRVTSSLADGS
jgi:hypothetical protein